MAQLVIDIPTAQEQRVLDAICAEGGYDPASGLTQKQFSKKFVANWLKTLVRNQEMFKAQQAALDSLPPDADIT